MELEPKKKIKDFIKFKPLEQVDASKVVGLGMAGLFVGIVAGVFTQVAKLDLKGDVELDPPAPNMQDREPELVFLYQKFMSSFYRICPEQNKKKYQRLLKRSIRNAEAVMLIETQLLKNEIPRNTSQRNQANVHSKLAMEALRSIQELFVTEIIQSVKDTADIVFVHLANHIGNIYFSDLYMDLNKILYNQIEKQVKFQLDKARKSNKESLVEDNPKNDEPQKEIKPQALTKMVYPTVRPNNLITVGTPPLACSLYRGNPLLTSINVPKEWDWRTHKGSDGLPILAPVMDQGVCGCCYAVSTCQMLSHRISIATMGAKRPIISPQDMINCGDQFVQNTLQNPQFNPTLRQLKQNNVIVESSWYSLKGCGGGLVISAADYLVLQGSPSIKDVSYVSGKGVNFPPPNYCDLRNKYQLYYGKNTNQLTEGVDNGVPETDIVLPADMNKMNVDNMQIAIMLEGPIVTAMNVYTDFMYYPAYGDIYTKKSSISVNGADTPVVYEGGHAIVVVGWGERTNSDGSITEYWIAQNSWGTGWGLDGYFLIERGKNMCNFEYDAASVIPNLEVKSSTSSIASSSSSSDSDITGIILVSVGAALVLIIIVVVASIYPRRKKQK